jgi:uncharacterized protein YabN with tetrapyrrole methylase and pyrophosphatase domain
MVEFDMYGVKVSLKEVNDALKVMREGWTKRYPHELQGVNFSSKGDVFFQIRDLKNRARELDNQLEYLREIAAMLYSLTQSVEELAGQCKISRDVTRTLVSRVYMTQEQIEESGKRAEIRFEEEAGRGKRKLHRR